MTVFRLLFYVEYHVKALGAIQPEKLKTAKIGGTDFWQAENEKKTC